MFMALTPQNTQDRSCSHNYIQYVTSIVPCQWFAVVGWCGHDLRLSKSGFMVWCGDVISQPSPTRREGYLTKYIPLYTSGTQSVLRVIEMRGGLGG